MNRIFILILLSLTPAALAVSTSSWKHTSEADFQPGTMSNVVATNLGDLKLSRAVETLLEQDPEVSSVYAMVEAPDGTVFVGTGPNGTLMQISGGKVSKVRKFDEGQIFSLLIDSKGRLLVGTGGESGRIFRLDKPDAEPVEIYAGQDVQYVWSMVEVEGTLYAGTGPTGQLISIDADDKSEVLFDSNENNLLSLVSDGKDLLFAGTDPNGLVYRIDRKTKGVFVLYDAAESEISTLVRDAAGNLYAGTAATIDDTGMMMQKAGATLQQGRPEGGAGVSPLPAELPQKPEPPELPVPVPGEPKPIPQEPQGRAAPQGMSPVYLQVEAPEDGEPQAESEQVAEMEVGPDAVNVVQPSASGNAIYRIDRDGFVSEIFRQPVMVLSVLERDGVLLVGTGSSGLIFEVNPKTEETIILARTEPKQIMCMSRAKDGTIYLGLSNTGGIATLSPGFAAEGTFVSPVLDASQISRFGKIQLHGSLPKDTTLKIATRSGNVADSDGAGWSEWSEDVEAIRFVPVTAPAGRYLQYRVTFTSGGTESPVIEDVTISYQMPNLPPVISAVLVNDVPNPNAVNSDGTSMLHPPATSRLSITWQATDPNNDTLKYDLFYRTENRRAWLKLHGDLEQPMFEWETRAAPDGRYEIRVVASDSASNPAGEGRQSGRVSDPVYVDNSPPVIGRAVVEVKGNAVTVSSRIVDVIGTVASIHYSVDASDDWQTILPSDKISDSAEEAVKFTITGLKPGNHQVTLKARDARGNEGFETVLVSIGEKAKK